MKKSKILLSILFIFCSLFVLGSCFNDEETEHVVTDSEILENLKELDNKNLEIELTKTINQTISQIDFFNINDFHGAIDTTDTQYGVSRTVEYLRKEYNKNPGGTVMCIGGDLFQGTSLSNFRYGRDLVNIFNTLPIDYMVLGNHEFDWEIDTVLSYFDGVDSNGEANFPLLACNVFVKSSGKLLDNVKPYIILNKGQYKIGVIGYLGFGLEKDIAAPLIEPYEIKNPTEIIKSYAKELKTAGCDMIIVSGHDDNDSVNTSLALFGADARVDLISNGHSHSTYDKVLTGTCGNSIPCIQSGSSGKYVGHVTLKEDGSMFRPTLVTNQKVSSSDTNPSIDSYVARLKEITSPKFERVLTKAGQSINKYGTIDYLCNLMVEKTGADVSFINNGGIRADAFPINKGEEISISKIYKIIPFDNYVKTCLMSGAQIVSFAEAGYDISYSDSLDLSTTMKKINGVAIDYDAYYKVATIDYVFEKPEYPFLKSTDIHEYGLFREMLINKLEEIGTSGTWVVR